MGVGCRMGFGKMSHFHHEFIPSLSLSELVRPLQIHSVGICPFSLVLRWGFHPAFLLMACFAHLLHSVVLPRKVSLPSFTLLSNRVQWSLQCCTGPEEYVIWACPSSSLSFHSPGTTHSVCNHNFLSTFPPITNISNSKVFSHAGWKQWPFPLDLLCLQLLILFLHVKGLA